MFGKCECTDVNGTHRLGFYVIKLASYGITITTVAIVKGYIS